MFLLARAAGRWPSFALPGGPGVPALVVSAPEDGERGREAWFSDYVGKFVKDALAQSLRQCLQIDVAARGEEKAMREAGTTSPVLADDAAQMVLTLIVCGQVCDLPVLSVRDVLGLQSTTRIALAPCEAAGSLNLRGRIVTAIDLRPRLGLPPRDAGTPAMSVAVDVGGELYSLLADGVGKVLSLDAAERTPNPPTLEEAWRQVSLGVHRPGDDLLALLDVERLPAIAA